ncbi:MULTISPECIES: hypothetical protein [Microbacterium]|uniref:hypothetical protein n=1 Tax=Microbacterium TaxID=33882 RepID=UPI000D65983E|nr:MULTISPECIES: hypothetical protein [Microbacterium]
MALSRPRFGAVALVTVSALLALAGCAAPTTETDAGGTASATPSPSTSQTADTDDGEDDGRTDADGEADPTQSRVRVGPAVDYGGPDGGDQGDAELIADGVWCETIAVFWGGAVPDGVRFLFQTALIGGPGLQVREGACGSAQNPACLGLTLEAGDKTVFCSLTVVPQADFENGTGISFAGRLECPTAEVCDAVVARHVDRGPPITVTAPADTDDEENDQQEQEQGQKDQDGEEQDQDGEQENQDQDQDHQQQNDQDPPSNDQDQG